MAGSQQAAGSRQQTVLDPALKAQLTGQLGTVQSGISNYANQANQAAGKLTTNFGQFNPSLQTNFANYNPSLQTNFQTSPTLDARAQGIVSQGQQGINNQTVTQQQQLANQFHNNPGLVQVLQAQAANQGQLQANPLLFQAAQDQTNRENMAGTLGNQALLQQAQQGAASQQMGNQAALQQSETGANLAGAGNAGLAQQLQFQSQPVAANQNLLSTLSSLAQLYGYQQATPLPISSNTSNTDQFGNPIQNPQGMQTLPYPYSMSPYGQQFFNMQQAAFGFPNG